MQDLEKRFGRTEGPTQMLRDLEFELNNSIAKDLKKDDIVKLAEVDEGLIGFIGHVRKYMDWGDRSLNDKEVQVFFGMLNETHDSIVNGLRMLIKEFNARDNVNPY